MKLSSCIAAVLLVVASAAFAQPAKVERHVTTIKQPDVTVSRVAVHTVHSSRLTRLDSEIGRLESILETTQDDANLPPSALMPTANEANMLANRIWSGVHRSYRGNSNALDAASQLRMHIREMHKAAASSDVAGVQFHAREALPFANQIDELQ